MNEDFKVRTVVYNVNVAQRALLLGHGRPGPAGNGVIQLPTTTDSSDGVWHNRSPQAVVCHQCSIVNELSTICIFVQRPPASLPTLSGTSVHLGATLARARLRVQKPQASRST